MMRSYWPNSFPTFTVRFLLSASATLSICQSETADEYHARVQPLLEDAFYAQDETSAWWLGFSHPEHGDQYWTFGNSSDSDDAFPPDVPATTDDHFYIGSISKSFGATVNLKLIEQGKFALNDSVKSIVPEFAEIFPQYSNYTPADLMGMQTLVPDFLNNPDGFLANITADPNHRFTIQQIISFAMKDYPVKLPANYAEELVMMNKTLEDFGIDTYFEYSTTNFLAMEYIAETVTGQSMQDLVSSVVTSPLGLGNTVLPLRDAPEGVLPEPVSHTYFGKSCVHEINKYGGNASVGDRNDEFVDSVVNFGSGGSMYSTIVDLLQWSKSGLGDSILSADTVEMRHLFKPTNIALNYGLGLHLFYDILPIPYEPAIITGWYGHGGDALGSNVRSFKNDDLGASFASAVNSCNYSHLNAVGFKVLVEDYTFSNEASSISPTPTSGAPDIFPTQAPTSKVVSTAPMPNSGENTMNSGLLAATFSLALGVKFLL